MKRRGFSLSELMVGVGLFSFALFGTLSLLITGLRSYLRTTTDLNNSQPNSQAIRHVVENIRQAMTVSASTDGKTLTFTLPKRATTPDAVTGELEYAYPVVSDGVARSYTITSGKLVENPGGIVVLKGISTVDPDSNSTLYNAAYKPFTISQVGARTAVTVNFITSAKVIGKTRFSKAKTTVLVQNIR